MRAKLKFVIGCLIGITLVGMYVNTRKRPAPPVTPSFLFEDNYEDNPTIHPIEDTPETVNITVFGDVDSLHWTEMGKASPQDPYHVDYSVARSGSLSAELTIYPPPEGYSSCVTVSRYFRSDGDKGVVVEAIYETGAYFYVPEGHTPICSVSQEYWYDHGRQHKVGAIGLNPETGEIYAWTYRGWRKVGKVTFEPETWFKLWVKNDYITKKVLSIGYESATQSKSFEIMEPMADIQTSFSKYDKRFFLVYATIAGTTIQVGDVKPFHWDKPRKAYVDDFYSKVVG